jgi:hypothetical protein
MALMSVAHRERIEVSSSIFSREKLRVQKPNDEASRARQFVNKIFRIHPNEQYVKEMFTCIENYVGQFGSTITAEEWQKASREFHDYVNAEAPYFLTNSEYMDRWPKILQKVQKKLRLHAFLKGDLESNYTADPAQFLKSVIQIAEHETATTHSLEGSIWLSQLFTLPFIEENVVKTWLEDKDNKKLFFHWAVLQHWKYSRGQ